MNSTRKKTKQFLKQAFQDNPSYSFNNWEIMYNHGLTVQKFAMQIAESVSCDNEIVSIGALLHDIGKTYKADNEILREKHGQLAYEVSKDLLKTLNLSDKQLGHLRGILSEADSSIEADIIHDADIIAFFADKQLQQALSKWADEKGLPNELQRKLDKQEQLKLSISKETAKPLAQQMKDKWKLK